MSPLKPPAVPADTDQQGTDGGNSALGSDLQPPRVSMETSNLRPQTAKTEDEVEEADEASGPLTISELVYRSRVYNQYFFYYNCLWPPPIVAMETQSDLSNRKHKHRNTAHSTDDNGNCPREKMYFD